MKTYREVMKYFGMKSCSEILLTNIQDNSKKVNSNSVFVAIGNGNNYINEAKSNGAKLILSDKDYEFLKEKLMNFCLWFYDDPSFDLVLIGITGTNGKSTTANFIAQLLPNSLLISNIEKRKNAYFVTNTTPSSIEIVHALLKAKERNYKYVIMEVSSIGIKEKRVKGLLFDVVGLTNLTSDHLDYHHSVEEYQKVKIDFINEQFSKIYIGNVLTDVIDRIERPYIQVDEKIIQKKLNLSKFNIENLALAYQIALNYVKKSILDRKVRKVKLPKGRSQIISKKPLVIVDYAHTEVAFLTILLEYKKKTKGRLLVLFGAGGNRDKIKRAKYGEYVYQYADIAIVTNDNPRNEKQEYIVEDIIKINPSFFLVEYDRKQAIHRILKIAKKDDTVLILGRGHEQIQLIKNLKIYLSDVEEVRKWIKK